MSKYSTPNVEDNSAEGKDITSDRKHVEVVPEKNASEKKVYHKAKKITLRIDANYKITGKYSGQVYIFDGAGATLNVDETDVDWLLSLRQKKGCCGGGGENPVFEVAL